MHTSDISFTQRMLGREIVLYLEIIKIQDFQECRSPSSYKIFVRGSRSLFGGTIVLRTNTNWFIDQRI